MSGRWALLPLVVAVGAFAAFIPALDGQFLNWDDGINFVNNQGYRGLGWTQIRWMFTSTLMGHYIPITWLTLGLNYVLGGMDPRGYHLGNLLLHATNSVLFYFVARRLLAAARDGGSQNAIRRPSTCWGAAFAALVFAVHPLRVESVAWATERRDVLCGLFFLLATLAYLRGVEQPGPIRGGWRAASLAAFAAALLSKASAMPLPAALLLIDVYPLRRRGDEWRRLIVEKLPYVLLAAAAAAVALVALWIGGPVTSYKQYGPAARGAMVVYSLVFYPAKFVFPAGLSPMYELPVQVHLTSPQFLGPLLVLAVITIVLVWLRRRWVAGLVVWSYSALMVLPTGGVVHAGLQLAHDRYSYLSGLGFAVLAGSAVVWVLDRRLKGGIRPWMIPALFCGAALIVAVLGFSSWGQSQIWRDSESLWRWAVDIDPDCSLCYLNLSEAVIADAKRNSAGAASRASEAEAYARRALALRPSSAKPYFNLGSLLVMQQRYGEAEVPLRAYISLDPRDPAGPERLGLLYLVMNRPAEAIPLLRQSLTMDPASDARRTSIVTALRQRANLLRDGEGPNEAVVLEREAAALTAGRR